MLHKAVTHGAGSHRRVAAALDATQTDKGKHKAQYSPFDHQVVMERDACMELEI